MAVWDFFLPTRVIFGVGCLSKVSQIVDSFDPNKIMLVTGKNSMKKSGFDEKIKSYLKGFELCVFDQVVGNPTTRTVEDGIQFLKQEHCDLVIGLGGGSVIDAAKAISKLGANPGGVDDYLSNKMQIQNKGFPLVAVPTVAGTGSEVTPYASIINQREKVKASLTHESIYPDVAIVDPSLTVTTPKFVTATAGLDALSHCIEAYWSKRHTPISDAFALAGVELVYNNLSKAFNNPEYLDSREKMSLGSLFSGIAIGISRTTIVHSVSYPLTVHFSIPHGLACSLTLPSFIKYNAQAAKDRIQEIAKKVNASTPDELVKKVTVLISEVKLPSKLSAVGVQEKDVDLIIKEGFRPDRAENNPRTVTAEDLRQILQNIV